MGISSKISESRKIALLCNFVAFGLANKFVKNME